MDGKNPRILYQATETIAANRAVLSASGVRYRPSREIELDGWSDGVCVWGKVVYCFRHEVGQSAQSLNAEPQ